MNPAEYLEKVAALLDHRRPVSSGLYQLYAKGRQFHLVRFFEAPDEAHKIRVLSSIDINAGPTPQTWDAIQDRIAVLQKQGVL